jgi:hypothetical protein
MSSLLNKLQKDGSQLTGLDGKSSPLYDGQSQYIKGLEESQLDLNGKKPLAYDRVSQYQLSLNRSLLDLDGKTPAKYLDNPPR